MQQNTSTLVFIFQRVLQAIPLLIAVVIINFSLIQLAPGDPVTALIGEYPAKPGYVEEIQARYGLDKPVYVQLYRYALNVGQGDFGYSFAKNQAVTTVVLSRVVNTLILSGSALIIAIILGITFGVISAMRPYSLLDNFFTSSALVIYAVPNFWLGQLLILLFAVHLGILPAQGMRDLRALDPSMVGGIVDVGKHLILPAVALSGGFFALITRVTRASMLEVMGKEYVTTAYAKGLSSRTVWIRHGLRNALLPIVTLIGFQAGFLLSGSALVETVFGWPGVGRLLLESVLLRDYPVLMGIFVMVAIMVLVANLITDISYSFLDPRIRY